MVIQRIQSLLLLIAAVLTVVFIATPYARIAADGADIPVYASDSTVYLILNVVIALLLFIGIFLYKNLRLQRLVTLAAAVLTVASAVIGGIILWCQLPEASPVFAGGITLLVLAFIAALFAYRYMGRDQKLLRSYDRLR